MGKGYIHRTIKAILGRREAENEATESKTMKHSFVRNRLKTMGLIQMALPIFLVSYFIVFILGSIWGSFSNVCIHRLPNNMGVAKGRSYCPSCKKPIRWYDNIPIFSYVLLKAKCRDCSVKINIKYLLVELICALSFVWFFYLFGLSFTTLLFFILSIFDDLMSL